MRISYVYILFSEILVLFTQAGNFSIIINKISKIMEIFDRTNLNLGVLSQHLTIKLFFSGFFKF
jgi:hypothetical protein